MGKLGDWGTGVVISGITCDRIATNKVKHNSLFIIVTALAFHTVSLASVVRQLWVCVWVRGEQGEELIDQ